MRERKEIPGINAASMADIAFLLLIFFILITKIDNSVGISRNLPPVNEEQQQNIIDINKRNVLEIILKNDNQILLNNKPADFENISFLITEFILNNGKNPELSDSPEDAVILLKISRNCKYDVYIRLQNEITSVYNELRINNSLKIFGKTFKDLNGEQQQQIRNLIPMQISESEFSDENNQK